MPMRLQRDDLLHLIAICPQFAQQLHRVGLRRNLGQTRVRNQLQLHTLVQQPMTEQQRRNRSGMVPPGLVPTPARTGRSIRASTPTLVSMAPSIELAGDAPCGGRRANERKRSLPNALSRQRRGAWRDPPLSPLVRLRSL